MKRYMLNSNPPPPPPPTPLQLSLPPYLNNKINQGVRTGFAGLAKLLAWLCERKLRRIGFDTRGHRGGQSKADHEFEIRVF